MKTKKTIEEQGWAVGGLSFYKLDVYHGQSRYFSTGRYQSHYYF